MVRIDPEYFGKPFLGPGMRIKNYDDITMPIRCRHVTGGMVL